ncbi:hypothetical protein FAP94_13105 [Morganella morganii]|nr:hypothetical protein [Morganella morganii]
MSAVENARLDTHEQVELFFSESKFKMLDYSLLDDSDVSKVFDDYFLQKGAFTPKKRSKNVRSKEFPDAFQLELIRRSTFSGDRIGVVSRDIDFTEGLNSDNGIEKYPSLKSLFKVLQSIESGSYSYLNYLENEIYYRHTPDVNYETLFSRVVLDLPDVLEVDFNEALELLKQKGLVSC